MDVQLLSGSRRSASDSLARRLAILDALTAAISEAVQLPMLLDRTLATTLEVTGVDGGGIFLLDEQTGRLHLHVHQGVGRPLADSFTANPGKTLHALVSDPKAPVIVRDLKQFNPRPEVIDEGLRFYAGIPLQARGRVLGVLVAVSRTIANLDDSDRDLLISIGKQVGAAIERAQLYGREQRRAQVMETISEVGRRLGAIRSERELLPRIVRYVRERLGYEAATLFLLDEPGKELIIEAASGLGNDRFAGVHFSLEAESSIVGWVSTHNQPLLANDVSREPRYRQAGGQPASGSELAVPILVDGHNLGVLDVQSVRTDAFDAMDCTALQTLAGQIAVAIENARLHEDMERALQRTRAFQSVTAAITASLDLSTTLERALDAAMDVFQADRAAIFLDHPDTKQRSCAASRNLSAAYLAAVSSYYRSGAVPPKAGRPEAEQSSYIEDAQISAVAPPLAAAARREGFRSMLFLPLVGGTEPFGVFVLYHDEVRPYAEREIVLARTFAGQARIAIEHARLFEAERRARDQASTILDATRSVASSLQVDDVLREAARCVAAALHQRYAGVWLLNEAGSALLPVLAISDPPDPTLEDFFATVPALRVGERPELRTLLEEGRPHVAEHAADSGAFLEDGRQQSPFQSYLTVPLVSRDRPLGAITVAVLDPAHHFEAADVEVAFAIARSAALAVENARLYEQAQRLAISEERNRLARELHDSVTQSLFSMTLICQALPRLLERSPAQARERIDRLNELGRGALTEMRALIFELRPAALEDEGLMTALRKHVDAFRSREAISVQLVLEGERRLPAATEEGIFRVAQEALNNVAKHAQARRVDVLLVLREREAELTVEDDGIGFDLDRAPQQPRSLGMTSMRERAAILGGHLTVSSTPGQGTRICLSLPLAISEPGEEDGAR